SADKLVKILADGDVKKKLTIDVDKVAATEKEKIEKAGGSAKPAAADDDAKAETKKSAKKAAKKEE
ncbi:MAG: uL15 family ribosomal protein, partial [Treponemataceae bacterium]|nr:uL15 family ribosomal protein [Treponemataceae bacterium]